MEERAAQRRASVAFIARILLAQAGIGVFLAVLLWGLYGPVAAYSVFLGSLACVIPNMFLALRLALPLQDAKAVLRAAWLGEIGKIALTIVMFVLIMSLVRPLQYLPLFAGYIAAQLMIFSGLLFKEDTQDGP